MRIIKNYLLKEKGTHQKIGAFIWASVMLISNISSHWDLLYQKIFRMWIVNIDEWQKRLDGHSPKPFKRRVQTKEKGFKFRVIDIVYIIAFFIIIGIFN